MWKLTLMAPSRYKTICAHSILASHVVYYDFSTLDSLSINFIDNKSCFRLFYHQNEIRTSTQGFPFTFQRGGGLKGEDSIR